MAKELAKQYKLSGVDVRGTLTPPGLDEREADEV
jgi:hypothetical protein